MEYKFIPMEMNVKFTKLVLSEHRDIIEKSVSEGYKYTGWVPTELGVNGILYKIDLIFEK